MTHHRQLLLPLPGTIPEMAPVPRIPKANRVFVNRNLRMESIDWVGFDMDYTLAIYRQEAMDALSVELIVANMIRRGYPESLRRLHYDTRFPIRGLLIDRKLGHVLKMDRHKVVYKGYHGLRRLTREELTELYQRRRIRPHTSRYHWIDTLFGLCEVTAYAAIIEALERKGGKLDYDQIFSDVRASIDDAHREGSVYAKVTEEFGRYIEKDERLARTLHKLRSAGKKLFLLTNSPWHYTESVLSFLLSDQMPEYPTFRHYFDVCICLAGKPHWFQDGRPFLERDVTAGAGDLLRHVRGPLERGKVYEGGNLRDFERFTGADGGNVLYVGDHIYGDILRSKKESSWRTAMIIQELDQELPAHEACEEDLRRQRDLEEQRQRLEDELRYYQARYKELSRKGDGQGAAGPVSAGDARIRMKRAVERVRGELRHIDEEYQALGEDVGRRFHPYWGALLKEHHEMSSFGLQVDTYADVYMRRVSSLRAYSPQQFFRSPHDLMPHEI